MALRFRRLEKLKVSATSAEKTQFFNNYDDDTAEQIFDDLIHENDGTLAIDASTTEALSFGDVTEVFWCHVEADQDFSVSIDGNTAFPVRARTNSKGTKVAQFSAGVNPTTSIEITNLDATNPLAGRYVLLGDLTP